MNLKMTKKKSLYLIWLTQVVFILQEKHSIKDLKVHITLYCTHSKLRPPFLLVRFSYKYGGGAYN